VALEPHENLQLYISATSNMVSTAIIIEQGESDTNRKIQCPIYFISEVLSDSKTQYFHIIKLAYTLLITSRKPFDYFQAHRIEVHTSSTLGVILNNREVTKKIAKCTIELFMYNMSTSLRQLVRIKH
jgi:hypothetical protein